MEQGRPATTEKDDRAAASAAPGTRIHHPAAGLVHLARSAERRPDPPAGIGKVRGKLVQALEEAAIETALVETFVQGLLERPARADGLLREARQGFAARSATRRETRS